jgi:hypothetical protein
MKIKKEYIDTKTIGYLCDVCSDPIPNDSLRLIDFSGNTESGNYRECDLCESCFGKVETFIVHILCGAINEV